MQPCLRFAFQVAAWSAKSCRCARVALGSVTCPEPIFVFSVGRFYIWLRYHIAELHPDRFELE
jgi:hypothetical protein